MIKSMVRVFTLGVMVANTVVSGLMENSMDKESIDTPMGIVVQEFGMRVKGQCGLTMNECSFLLHYTISFLNI
jgi:hypothetical protein